MAPDEQGGAAGHVQQTRRRLLRGTFAAPAVLTVYSGGARAAGSVGACLARPNAVPASANQMPTRTNADVLFRVQLYGVVRRNGSVASWWVRGADLAPMVRNGKTPFLLSSEFQQFQPSTNALIGPKVNSAPTLINQQQFIPVESYAVVRVDADGAIVGIGGTGTGSVVSDSCWNSFAMAAPP